MIRGTDFILNPSKLEKEYMLVEVSEWTDFNTKEKLGVNYTVLLPRLQFEKVRVNVPDIHPVVSKEELAQQGQIPVSFEGLQTWASVYNGRLSIKAEATGMRRQSKLPEVK